MNQSILDLEDQYGERSGKEYVEQQALSGNMWQLKYWKGVPGEPKGRYNHTNTAHYIAGNTHQTGSYRGYRNAFIDKYAYYPFIFYLVKIGRKFIKCYKLFLLA